MLETPDSMPHRDHFLAALTELNSTRFPRAVLAYQHSILTTGSFALPCPWTGVIVPARACYLANASPLGFGDLIIAYRLACHRPVWLLAGGVKDGYPLFEALVADGSAPLWSRQPGSRQDLASLRQHLTELEDSAPQALAALEVDAPATLLLGHPNFAHHLWNELSALDRWLEREPAGLRQCQLAILCEPLLPLAELFPTQSALGCRRVDPDALPGLQAAMVTRIGGTQIPTALRQRIREAAARLHDRRLTGPVEQALQGRGPVFWLTLRLDSRTAVNQDHFLAALVRALAAEFPEAAFLLDGFSWPADIDRSVYASAAPIPLEASSLGVGTGPIDSLARLFRARERALADHLASVQRELAGLASVVINLSGLAMPEVIHLGRLADYYVSHAGSLQHKVGWLHNGAGFVHGNTTELGPGVCEWLAAQLQDGVAPDLLSADLVKDTGSIRSINQVERNRDYFFVNIDAAVAEVMTSIRRRGIH